MKSNFDPLMREVLRHEGGFTANPKDKGNWTGGVIGRGVLKGTKYGIAASAHPDIDIKNLTIDQAIEIYRQQYAPPVRFDELPSGLDWVALDASINSGPKRSVKLIQVGLGFGEDDCDGSLGPATLRAILASSQPELIVRSCQARLAFMRGLDNWETFKGGWTTRVKAVQAKALQMAGSLPAVA